MLLVRLLRCFDLPSSVASPRSYLVELHAIFARLYLHELLHSEVFAQSIHQKILELLVTRLSIPDVDGSVKLLETFVSQTNLFLSHVHSFGSCA